MSGMSGDYRALVAIHRLYALAERVDTHGLAYDVAALLQGLGIDAACFAPELIRRLHEEADVREAAQ